MILAVGVAAGQVLGGLLVSAHLLTDAWRPALLLNAPVGALLLLGVRRGLPPVPRGPSRRLDLVGAAVLGLALLTFVLPLTFGRDAGWPAWVWPCLACCALSLIAFVVLERRIARRGREPLFEVRLLALPSVAAAVAVVMLGMASYAGFLVSLTIHLQDGLGFTPLHAGLVFAIYASGFATASLTWTRAGAAARDRLPVIGPLAMGAALLGVGLIASGGGWPLGAIAPLLFAAGAGHACGFSPLANRLTTTIGPEQAGQVSGLLLTASLIGQVVGVAAFVGVYLGAAPHGSAHALEVTTVVLAAVLVATAACAVRAVSPARVGSAASTPA
jgi:MFS family permease